MKILFERCAYSKSTLEKIIPVEWITYRRDYVETLMVGYFYSQKNNGEPVFILPKVFVNDGCFFGTDYSKFYDYDRLLQGWRNGISTKGPWRRPGFFLYYLSIQVVKAIGKYQKSVDTIAAQTGQLPTVHSKNCDSKSTSFLELYNSLLEFYRRNKNLFTFISRTSHAGKKIKWNKTIASQTPAVIDDFPVYIQPYKTVKKINYEEELIKLLYSVLEDFKKKFGIEIKFEFNYPIYRGHEFKKLLDGKGVRILKRIRHKYFRDVFIKLWELLYAFFDLGRTGLRKGDHEEWRVCSSFEHVFEDMVDDLIGDKDLTKDEIYFKDQKDGKIVDHLMNLRDLLYDQNIFFVADSKYYKEETSTEGRPLEKQFTYAKNIIQYGINQLLEGGDFNKIRGRRYRDAVTEGYNITPNFFIRARVDDGNRDDMWHIRRKEGDQGSMQVQFENRLFDRDTLIVLEFEAEFRFVLSIYISGNKYERERVKSEVMAEFRKEFTEYLNGHYEFHECEFESLEKLEGFIKFNFKDLIGKVYKPSGSAPRLYLALAASCGEGERRRVLSLFENTGYMVGFNCGVVTIRHVILTEEGLRPVPENMD